MGANEATGKAPNFRKLPGKYVMEGLFSSDFSLQALFAAILLSLGLIET